MTLTSMWKTSQNYLMQQEKRSPTLKTNAKPSVMRMRMVRLKNVQQLKNIILCFAWYILASHITKQPALRVISARAAVNLNPYGNHNPTRPLVFFVSVSVVSILRKSWKNPIAAVTNPQVLLMCPVWFGLLKEFPKDY
uniref:Uncharacterized protein n=1 Tax=Glossina pallidipes TaxID=7398 RepID=A0A1A9Z2U8_GLOPL